MDIPVPVSKAIPRSLKQWLKARWRDRVLHGAIRDLVRLPNSAPPRQVFERLVYGWGNAAWSVQYEFMEAIVEYARRTNGPVLESGPGLSSLLMATCARDPRLEIWSLEHNASWAEKLSQRFAQLGMTHVKIVHAPLVSYGDYDWYDLKSAALPTDFGLVLCDGPPSDTRGGRYGMLPQISGRLRPDSVILIDDMKRQAEQDMLDAWVADYGGTFVTYGDDKPYAVYHPGHLGP